MAIYKQYSSLITGLDLIQAFYLILLGMKTFIHYWSIKNWRLFVQEYSKNSNIVKYNSNFKELIYYLIYFENVINSCIGKAKFSIAISPVFNNILKKYK